MTARKTPRKKTARKKTSRKKTTRKTSRKSAFQRLEDELPRDLRAYSRRVRRGLTRLEREIEKSRADARRRFARLLRDVSHQLGRIEAEGEKRWRQRTDRARREAVKLLKRLEQAIEPPKRKKSRGGKKTTRAAKKTARAGRKTTARKKTSTRKKTATAKPAKKAAAREAPKVIQPQPAGHAPPGSEFGRGAERDSQESGEERPRVVNEPPTPL